MNEPVFIIQTTLPRSWDEFEIGNFSQQLIESGAACVQYSAINSMYRWKGNLESSLEWSLEIKVSTSHKDAVLSKIESLHPYEVPQLVHWQVTSSRAYGEWIRTSSE
tara:strand:+ start:5570 stop:5890 length:321 start_codon:yes stop_codon:yes gene_type:complete